MPVTELERRRKELNLSQERLGELVGVSRSHVNHIEHGRRRPSHRLRFHMARLLGVEPYDLLRPAGEDA